MKFQALSFKTLIGSLLRRNVTRTGLAAVLSVSTISSAPALGAGPDTLRSSDARLPELPCFTRVRNFNTEDDNIPPKPETRGVVLLIVGLSLLVVGGTTAGVSVAALQEADNDGIQDGDAALIVLAGVGGVTGLVGSILGTVGGVQLIISSIRRGNWENRYGDTVRETALNVAPFISPEGTAGLALNLSF